MRRPHSGVELVDGPRLKTRGLVRVWTDGALEAASCRVDGRLHAAEALQRRAASPGGRALLCKVHACELARDYYADNSAVVRARRRAARAAEAPSSPSLV